MKKRILALALVLCVLLVLLMFSASAATTVASGACGDSVTWELDSEGLLTISGSGEIDEFDWDAHPWRECKDQITTLVVENGVTSVCSYAFYECRNLRSVQLPDSIQKIGHHAFCNCAALEEIVIPNAVTEISYSTFSGCEHLAHVVLPEGITYIDIFAFCDCYALEKIDFPGDLASIYVDSAAFSGCPLPIVQKFYPGNYDFSVQCGDSMTCSLHDGVLTISGTGAMWSVANQTPMWQKHPYAEFIQKIVVENGVTELSASAFDGLSNLEEVQFCGSMKTIPNQCFFRCRSLRQVELPEDLETLEYYAFYECYALQSVSFPASIKTVGGLVFKDCDVLCDVFYSGTMDQWFDIDLTWGNEALRNAVIHTPDGTFTHHGTFGVDNRWTIDSDGNLRITGTGALVVYEINDQSDSWKTNARTLTIADGITTIGAYVFQDCGILECVSIPKSIENFDNSAFSGCDALQEVYYEGTTAQFLEIVKSNTFPENTVIHTADGVFTRFGNCGEDAAWTLENGVLRIAGTGAIWGNSFYDDQTITDVVINEGITDIGSYAFSRCPGLKSVVFPDSLESVADHAIYECGSLSSVTIPKGAINASIGDDVFYNSGDLTDVYFDGTKQEFILCSWKHSLPDYVATIHTTDGTMANWGVLGENVVFTLEDGQLSVFGSGAMYDYAYSDSTPLQDQTIRSAVISEGVTSVGDRAFYACRDLADLELPDSVTRIGFEAFFGCTALENVVIPAGIASVDETAFSQCSALTDLYCLGTAEAVRESAPDGARVHESVTDVAHHIRPVHLEASCEQEGCDTYACDCGLEYPKTNVVPALGHQTEIHGAKDATCTEPGSTGDEVCTVCGETVKPGETIPAKGHQWDDGVITTEPSETAEGVKTFTCTVCGETRTESIPMLEPEKLPAPTAELQLNANGKPRLTWTAVDGAVKYEVYKATSVNGAYTKLFTTSNLAMTHTGAKAGTMYFYEVCAIDANGVAGEFSAVQSIRARLAAPTAEVTLNANGKPYLTWTAVDGAAKYEVYKATSATGTYTKLFTTTGQSMTHTGAAAGTMYFYKVCAIDAKNYYGVESAVQSIRARLGAPTAELTLNANGKPRLTWTAVDGAAKYEVFKATSADGPFTKLFTTTGLAMTHTGAAAGTTYYYKVRAIDAKNYYGVDSAVQSVRTPMGAPSVTVTVNDKGQPRLTWKAVTGAAKYEVWRATSEDGTYSKFFTTTNLTMLNSTSPGKVYFYKVRAIDENGEAGPWSAVLTNGLTAPTASLQLNANGKPRLTWKAVDGAVKYEVYKATSPDGAYTKLFTTSNLVMTHTGAAAGTTYFYKIRAIDSNGNAGLFSVVRSIAAK